MFLLRYFVLPIYALLLLHFCSLPFNLLIKLHRAIKGSVVLVQTKKMNVNIALCSTEEKRAFEKKSGRKQLKKGCTIS